MLAGGGAGGGAGGAQRLDRPHAKNRVSAKRRHLSMTPNDHLAAADLGDVLDTIVDMAAVIATTGGPPQVLQQLLALADDVEEELVELTTFDAARLPKRVLRTADEYRRMLNADSALVMFRCHEGTFLSVFGITLGEFEKLVQVDFLGPAPFVLEKRGKLSADSALLLLFARLRATGASLSGISDFWGVDAAFISAFFIAVCERLLLLHDHRLRLDTMRARFADRLDGYRDAIEYLLTRSWAIARSPQAAVVL